jgi:hypothetical protein
MTNVKITELSAITAPVITDVVPIVSDPAGTPVTKKVTVANLLNTRRLFSIVPAGNFALTAGTSAQAALPTTGDVFTLEGTTSYKFEGAYFIDKSGTTCTTALSFALAGGASVTSILYTALCQNVAKNTTGATHGSAWIDTVSATVVNATATTAAYIKFEGIIRMNAGGTVTPQITFSATPTTPIMLANSYIWFEKIGTSTENTLGSVA